MTSGLLFVLTEPGPVDEARFNEWYDTEHAPARLALDGVHNGQRFRAADAARPTWLASYDLELETLDTPEYQALRVGPEREFMARFATLDRRIYAQTDDWGRGDGHPPLMVATSVTTSDPDGYADWYAREHVPLLHALDGWTRTRRFQLLDGDAPEFLGLHELQSAAPLDTDGYRHAISTPWRTEVMQHVTRRERRVFALHRVFSG